MDPATLAMADELVKLLQKSTIDNYGHLAGFTIAYFDWLLVLDSEIKLIWNAQGVKMKILYLFTRYLPLIYFPLFLWYRFDSSVTQFECTVLYGANSLMFTLAAICAALVAAIRTWAVWAKETRITYVLFGTYTMASALIMILYIMSLKNTSEQIISGLRFPLRCNPQFDSFYLPAAFVVEAAFDAVVLMLMLVRGASLYRFGKDRTLFRTIYSDGILFYVYITTISIINFSLLFTKGSHESLLLMFQGAARSVLACRIVLHIRMRHDKQTEKWQPDTPSADNGYAAVHIQRSVIESSDV